MAEPIVAVVMAAGLGQRFGGPIPKQVTTLTGKAVVAVAVESLAAGGCTDAVVVIKDGMHNHFRLVLAASPIPIHFVTGGDSRQDSVRRGLEYVDSHPRLARATKVLVHDAVRPLVPAYVVEDVIAALEGGAVAVAPAMPVVDTIREVDADGGSSVIDRDVLRAIQTPQGFDREIVTECHRRMAADGARVTDDLSCCELYGHEVKLVEGSRMAMKITEPVDLDIAETFAKAAAGAGQHSGKRVRRVLHLLDPRRARRRAAGRRGGRS
ncbi:2-C-methyl-D-erythritol 4-phosphate cytidylyltransferase [Acidipropionibacterium timonense]|uniref:2-C-methyl-D-erythritol 4-phosphate cytidylyltransferase n=1 Tax=Acidipropionibacterium timonense TaxID=2161818 RepID=UPI001030A5C4|nr:2-C-methyl-D-erythritol 4-phosphate cytidylyltransferase [Acidipropionibacterium timonense]